MVFGLFSKEKALQRTIGKATNKLAQQADRWAAMENLRKDGSEDALYGLCRRFAMVSMKSSEDEQEKQWVVDALVEKGEVAIGPVRRYLKNHAQLAFALQVLGKIVPKERALQVVDELIESEAPGYTRDPERRLDLIKWLGEWPGATAEDVVPRLVPYLKDHSEDVRFYAAEGLAHRDAARAAPELIEALVNPEEDAGRVKRRLAEILAEHRLPVGERADQVRAALGGVPATQAFTVTGGVVVAR
jgi:hypothetical protein